MESALTGLKILDLSRFAPGPFCTMILGDLGAEVIKVEENTPPAGASFERAKRTEKMPVASEFANPDSPFNPLNRNKRSIKINLKSEKGKKIFFELAAGADIIVEGFRPGVARRLGIEYETLATINPRIVYCSITGYGQDGPYAGLPGHDINYVACGGAIGAMSLPGKELPVPANFIGDMAAGGMQAAIGILAALHARARSGKGQFIDISMTDGVCNMLALYLSRYFQSGSSPSAEEKVSCGAVPYYRYYETADHKYVAIACSEPWFFATLCRVLECEDIIPFQMDPHKHDEIYAHLAEKFRTRTRDEWFNILSTEDVPISKVINLSEIAEDPQLRHRDMIVSVRSPEGLSFKQVGISIKLSDNPGTIRYIGDRPGESTAAILTELGYAHEEILKLVSENVVGLFE